MCPGLQIHPTRTSFHPSFARVPLFLVLFPTCRNQRCGWIASSPREGGRLPTPFYHDRLNGSSGKTKMETVYEQHHSTPRRKARSVELYINHRSELKINSYLKPQHNLSHTYLCYRPSARSFQVRRADCKNLSQHVNQRHQKSDTEEKPHPGCNSF